MNYIFRLIIFHIFNLLFQISVFFLVIAILFIAFSVALSPVCAQFSIGLGLSILLPSVLYCIFLFYQRDSLYSSTGGVAILLLFIYFSLNIIFTPMANSYYFVAPFASTEFAGFYNDGGFSKIKNGYSKKQVFELIGAPLEISKDKRKDENGKIQIVENHSYSKQRSCSKKQQMENKWLCRTSWQIIDISYRDDYVIGKYRSWNCE